MRDLDAYLGRHVMECLGVRRKHVGLMVCLDFAFGNNSLDNVDDEMCANTECAEAKLLLL
jgi:hypothetical protein